MVKKLVGAAAYFCYILTSEAAVLQAGIHQDDLKENLAPVFLQAPKRPTIELNLKQRNEGLLASLNAAAAATLQEVGQPAGFFELASMKTQLPEVQDQDKSYLDDAWTTCIDRKVRTIFAKIKQQAEENIKDEDLLLAARRKASIDFDELKEERKPELDKLQKQIEAKKKEMEEAKKRKEMEIPLIESLKKDKERIKQDIKMLNTQVLDLKKLPAELKGGQVTYFSKTSLENLTKKYHAYVAFPENHLVKGSFDRIEKVEIPTGGKYLFIIGTYKFLEMDHEIALPFAVYSGEANLETFNKARQQYESGEKNSEGQLPLKNAVSFDAICVPYQADKIQ